MGDIKEEVRKSSHGTHLKLVILILIVIVVTIISVAIFYFLGGKENNPVRDFVNDLIPILDGGEDETPPLVISDSSGGGGSGGGSAGGVAGGGGSGSGSSNCYEVSIAYSLLNINRTSTCNLEQSGVCVDKTVTCSIEVHNDDDAVAGTFNVELFYVEK